MVAASTSNVLYRGREDLSLPNIVFTPNSVLNFKLCDLPTPLASVFYMKGSAVTIVTEVHHLS